MLTSPNQYLTKQQRQTSYLRLTSQRAQRAERVALETAQRDELRQVAMQNMNRIPSIDRTRVPMMTREPRNGEHPDENIVGKHTS
jgi:hypothetical protein